MVQRWNYFVRHLLGVEPPRNYVIPAAAPDAGGRGRGGAPVQLQAGPVSRH